MGWGADSDGVCSSGENWCGHYVVVVDSGRAGAPGGIFGMIQGQKSTPAGVTALNLPMLQLQGWAITARVEERGYRQVHRDAGAS